MKLKSNYIKSSLKVQEVFLLHHLDKTFIIVELRDSYRVLKLIKDILRITKIGIRTSKVFVMQRMDF